MRRLGNFSASSTDTSHHDVTIIGDLVSLEAVEIHHELDTARISSSSSIVSVSPGGAPMTRHASNKQDSASTRAPAQDLQLRLVQPQTPQHHRQPPSATSLEKYATPTSLSSQMIFLSLPEPEESALK